MRFKIISNYGSLTGSGRGHQIFITIVEAETRIDAKKAFYSDETNQRYGRVIKEIEVIS